jgi:hypothetical protein
MGYGKGKEYYKGSYTHEQLWDMLNEGDDWAVEQGGSVWVSAASGMKAAREEMVVHVQSLKTQWTGAAADEFENRMAVLEEYSVSSEDSMKEIGELKIPALAQALKNAQSQATADDMYPSSTQSYEDWLESNNISETDADYQAKKPQYEQQYEQYVDARHDRMAQIVADLGEVYATRVETDPDFMEPPPPPPSDMPGNSTYQPPTGGVFAQDGLTPSNSLDNAPATNDTNGDGVVDQDDLEPVDGDWNYGSYDDVDSNAAGGLASGGVITGGGGGGMSTVGGTGGMGGSTLAGGAGLFGPAQGGSGSTSGRGAGSSPARSGANGKPGSSPARSGAGGRGGTNGRGLTQSSRNAIKGGSGNNTRGGTRTGYSDDDDDETYTRETWLREDDVEWGRNNVRHEELDDDDED